MTVIAILLLSTVHFNYSQIMDVLVETPLFKVLRKLSEDERLQYLQYIQSLESLKLPGSTLENIGKRALTYKELCEQFKIEMDTYKKIVSQGEWYEDVTKWVIAGVFIILAIIY